MLKVKQGDLDNMAPLFERYHKAIFGFLYHSTGNKTTSEDLVQTVFYRMIKYRHTFTGEGEFKTWMYHLSRNVLNDHFKKNKNLSFKADISVFDTQGENQIEEKLNSKDDTEKLSEALKKLGESSREVLVLSKYQELSYKEIALILNTSEANIKVKVHRAIAELRTVFFKLKA